MEDSVLMISSLAVFIMGVLYLLFLSASIEIEEMDLGSLGDKEIDRTVSIRAQVEKIRKVGDLVFISVSQDSRMDIMLRDAGDFYRSN